MHSLRNSWDTENVIKRTYKIDFEHNLGDYNLFYNGVTTNIQNKISKDY